jgi:hypothetical protein
VSLHAKCQREQGRPISSAIPLLWPATTPKFRCYRSEKIASNLLISIETMTFTGTLLEDLVHFFPALRETRRGL